MGQFSWTKQLLANIAARKAVVNTQTLEEFHTLLKMLHENGYTLSTQDYITWGKANLWNSYESTTCIRFGNSSSENGYCDIQYFKYKNYEIIKFSSIPKYYSIIKYLI